MLIYHFYQNYLNIHKIIHFLHSPFLFTFVFSKTDSKLIYITTQTKRHNAKTLIENLMLLLQ